MTGFLRLIGGPIPVNALQYDGPWPPPDTLRDRPMFSDLGGEYVRDPEATSKLTDDQLMPGLARGAEYNWRPDGS